MRFIKAHAYGNDFLYVTRDEVDREDLSALAKEMCARHTGIGADGLIVYERTADGASMRLFNPDGGRAEVSGNGGRGLAAILLREVEQPPSGSASLPALSINTEGGTKHLTRTGCWKTRQTFRAAMGLPENLRQVPIVAAGERLQAVIMTIGNPQCVVIGTLPEYSRFRRLGEAIETHQMFHEGTNEEFAEVETPARIRIMIWERGVGPTLSSGTGSCASLIAAAAFAGTSRDAEVVAPGGAQRVEWRDDSVYLTGWAEIVCEGEWLKNPRTD